MNALPSELAPEQITPNRASADTTHADVRSREEPHISKDVPAAIELVGVSKSFRKRTLAQRSYTTIKSRIIDALRGRTAKAEEGWSPVLNDVSLSIKPGKFFGVIGRNGSGKSTLLKLIAGIYRPDAGQVRCRGRISALIELGAGFHPDFTGRENIYLGGAMYGLNRKQVDARADKIIAYAELQDVIDDPVRTYSSGMYMRLGFSLAVHSDPDILLVDEVLAVGDAAFMHRCHDTIGALKERGTTMLLVSHDLDAIVRWCDEAIWLDRGNVVERGHPKYVVDRYLSRVEDEEQSRLELQNESSRANAADSESKSNNDEISSEDIEDEGKRWGNGDVEINSVRMLDESGKPGWLFHTGDSMTIEIDYTVVKPLQDLVFGIGILRSDGLVVHGTNTDIEDIELPPRLEQVTEANAEAFEPVTGRVSYRVRALNLLENSYFLDVAAHRGDGLPYDYHHKLYRFAMRGAPRYHGVMVPEHEWDFED